METIQEYAIAPWEEYILILIELNIEKIVEIANSVTSIYIATSLFY